MHRTRQGQYAQRTVLNLNSLRGCAGWLCALHEQVCPWDRVRKLLSIVNAERAIAAPLIKTWWALGAAPEERMLSLEARPHKVPLPELCCLMVGHS